MTRAIDRDWDQSSHVAAKPTLVLVSRRKPFRSRVCSVLEREGWSVRCVDSVGMAAQEILQFPARVLMLDGWAAITGAVSFLERVLASQPELKIVVASSISLRDRQAQHQMEDRVRAVYTEGDSSSDEIVKLLSQFMDIKEENGTCVSE